MTDQTDTKQAGKPALNQKSVRHAALIGPSIQSFRVSARIAALILLRSEQPMRIRRKNHPGMPPAQVEALGRLTPAEFNLINKNLSMPPVKVEASDSAAPCPSAAQRSEHALGHGAAKPPLLIGGESPKVTNPVKPCDKPIPSFLSVDDAETSESIVLDRNQNPVIKLGVKPIKGQKVGIDWVSCVFDQTQAWRYYLDSDHLISMQSYEPRDNEEVAAFIKDIFAWVLGIRETKESRWKEFETGMNGYKYAAAMPYQAGIVHVGHSSKTVLVTVTGQGALVALTGWETRLQWFLKCVSGWLTRIDLAYDDYEGEIYPVRTMREKASEGAFQRQGRPPKVELRGPWDQNDPDDSGLTLYIGSRASGKLTRIYEKGKQLAIEGSDWVRFECELHSGTFQLLLDMLTSPTKYFTALYPCCEWVEQGGERCPMTYKARSAVSTIQQSIDCVRHQFGGHLAFLRQNYSDTELLDLLVRKDGIPARLKSVDVLADQCQKFVNQQSVPSECPTDEPDFMRA